MEQNANQNFYCRATMWCQECGGRGAPDCEECGGKGYIEFIGVLLSLTLSAQPGGQL
jgi:DnaJ-class molecular chaperone